MKMAREIGKWIVTVVVTITFPFWCLPYAVLWAIGKIFRDAHKRIWRRG